jgi:hypothetical protein
MPGLYIPSGSETPIRARTDGYDRPMWSLLYLVAPYPRRLIGTGKGGRNEHAKDIPFRAPNANAHAERVIETMRAECLDWTLTWGRRHLDRTLRTYAEHYNRGRPHRALGLASPLAEASVMVPANPRDVRRRDVPRRAHPRVPRPRRLIESGFPTPTGWVRGDHSRDRNPCVRRANVAAVEKPST